MSVASSGLAHRPPRRRGLLRLGDLLGGQLRGWFALSALLPSLTAFLCMFWAWPKRFFPFALSFGHFRSRSSSFSRRWLRTNFWERDVLDVELFAAGIGQFLLSKRLRRDAIELILNEVRRSSDFLARLSLSLRLCNWLGKLVVFWTSSTILLPLILIPKVPSSS